jgi:hypothetical protein
MLPEPRKPTDIELKNAFVYLRSPPFYIGSEVTGSISDCFFYHRGYASPFWRRSRLRRFLPLAQRVHAARSFWRWLG